MEPQGSRRPRPRSGRLQRRSESLVEATGAAIGIPGAARKGRREPRRVLWSGSVLSSSAGFRREPFSTCSEGCHLSGDQTSAHAANLCGIEPSTRSGE